MPIQCDDPEDRLLITDDVLDYAAAYTMAARFKLQATTGARTFFSINQDGAPHDFIGAISNGLEPYNESEDGGTGSSPTLVLDTWLFVAVVASAAGARTLSQYVNGVLAVSHGDSSAGRTPATRLEIGGFTSSNANPTKAIVHDIRAWQAGLSGAELVAEMASPTPVRTADLYGHWPTPIGANRLLDVSGNGHHFTGVGTLVDVEDYPPGFEPNEGEAVELDFAVDGTGAINLDLAVAKSLGFNVQGVGVVSPALNVVKPLSLSIAGESSIGIETNVAKPLIVTVTGQSALTFNLAGGFVQAGRRVRSLPRQHTIYSKQRDQQVESVPRSRGIKSRERST